MKESDLAVSRRRFLVASAGIAASVALTASALDLLDRTGPRRLIVAAPHKVYKLDAWYEAPFTLSDDEVRLMLDGFVPPEIMEAKRSLAASFEPGTQQDVRVNASRQYKQMVFSLDSIGAKKGASPSYVYGTAQATPQIRRLRNGWPVEISAGTRVVAAIEAIIS